MVEQPAKLKVAVEQTPDACIVILEGELNLRTAKSLQEKADTCFNKDSTRGIVLDCAKLKYVDSSGMATLVEILKRCLRERRLLVLASVNPLVHNVFEVASLDSIFRMAPDRESALAELS